MLSSNWIKVAVWAAGVHVKNRVLVICGVKRPAEIGLLIVGRLGVGMGLILDPNGDRRDGLSGESGLARIWEIQRSDRTLATSATLFGMAKNLNGCLSG